MKKGLLLVISFVLLFSLQACKKKEEQPVPQTPGQMMPGQMPPGPVSPGQMPPGSTTPGPVPSGQMPPPGMMPPAGSQQRGMPGAMSMGKTQVLVPSSVKGKWEAAKIVFEDKMPKDLLTYLHNNCGFEVHAISEGMVKGVLSGLIKMGKLTKTDKGWETSIVV